MKNLFPKLLFAVSMAFLVGCGNDDPKTVAEKWLKAIRSGDLKSANEASTQRSHALNAFAISMWSNASDEEKKNNLIRNMIKLKLKVIKLQ